MEHSSRCAPRLRAVALWLAVSVGTLTLGRVAVPAAAGADRAPAEPTTFADLLVGGSAGLATLAGAWLWLVTTGVVVDVWRAGHRVAPAAGPLRRSLLAACGVVVLTAGTPAVAEPGPAGPVPAIGPGEHPLHGLPLPDRATGPGGPGGLGVTDDGERRPSLRTTTTVRVRSGDSLWSIAASVLGPTATTADVAAHWPRIHRANRRVLGTDPDLIHPGQRLVLPPHPTTPPGGTP